MKRTLWLVFAILLVALAITGCAKQQAPDNAITVSQAKFKYRGSLVWLYRDAAGKIVMLRGNSREITAVTKGNRDIFTAGKGEWATVENITKDQLVYVQTEVLPENQKQQVVKSPDYVLTVKLADLEAEIPEVKTEEAVAQLLAEFQSELLVDKNPLVTITMDSGKKIILELYPDVAPNTVNNFVYLVQHEFYNGTIFHRVIPEFMIQGGDPLGSGSGGPGYSIPGEFNANGFDNQLLHTRGVLSMARGEAPNTAGSQFFIVVADYPSLNGKYAAFGKVLSGLEEVDRIVNLATDPENDRPLEPPVMVKVEVETFGATYPAPFVMAEE